MVRYMSCAIPYSRIFYAYEQSRCPGSDRWVARGGEGAARGKEEWGTRAKSSWVQRRCVFGGRVRVCGLMGQLGLVLPETRIKQMRLR